MRVNMMTGMSILRDDLCRKQAWVLQGLKSFLHVADKFQKPKGIRDAWTPAQVPLNQVVRFLNARAGKNISSGVATAAHQPQVVRDSRRGGHVLSDDDDGVRIKRDNSEAGSCNSGMRVSQISSRDDV
jgi:hypothetical protein